MKDVNSVAMRVSCNGRIGTNDAIFFPCCQGAATALAVVVPADDALIIASERSMVPIEASWRMQLLDRSFFCCTRYSSDPHF